MTKLQQNLALSTPDAYNPFSGGRAATTPSVGDCSPASSTTIDPFQFELRRRSEKTIVLALADFKMSNARLFHSAGRQSGRCLRAWRVAARRKATIAIPIWNGTMRRLVDMVTGDSSTRKRRVGQPGRRAPGAPAPSFRPSPSSPCRWSRPRWARCWSIASMSSSPAALSITATSARWRSLRSPWPGTWSMACASAAPGRRASARRTSSRPTPSPISRVLDSSNDRDYISLRGGLARPGGIANYGSTCSRGISYSIFAPRQSEPQAREQHQLDAGHPCSSPKFILVRVGRLIADRRFLVDQADRHRRPARPAERAGARLSPGVSRDSSNPNVIRAAPTQCGRCGALHRLRSWCPPARYVRINDQFVNLLPQTVQGIDLAVLYNVPVTGIGKFDMGAQRCAPDQVLARYPAGGCRPCSMRARRGTDQRRHPAHRCAAI